MWKAKKISRRYLINERVIMDYTFKQKFKMWLCKILGHKLDVTGAWYYKGVHIPCKRCDFTITRKDSNHD